MSYFMHNNQGTLEKINYQGSVIVAPDGTKHPRLVLSSASWRAEHNIVEVIEPSYDESTHNKARAGFVDNGDGTWSEQATITLRPIDQLRQRVIAGVLRKREQVLRGGITVYNKPISTDQGDVDKYLLINAALGAGTLFPGSGIVIYTMEGERVKANNQAQFNQLLNQMALHFFQCDNNADSHIAAVEAETDPQLVADYDYSGGWPPNPDLGV